jgi:hypothetical protein
MDQLYNDYSCLMIALSLTIAAGRVLLINKLRLSDSLAFGELRRA